eukprot:GHVU01056482.1.p1 GENE.GHVU01056482.1~~GHVU01056482.1.p1  ORF type:complete len:103 (-),score=2.17 GHVU01056482.1:720-1028(-)
MKASPITERDSFHHQLVRVDTLVVSRRVSVFGLVGQSDRLTPPFKSHGRGTQIFFPTARQFSEFLNEIIRLSGLHFVRPAYERNPNSVKSSIRMYAAKGSYN